MMLILLILIVVGIVWFVGAQGESASTKTKSDSRGKTPLEILKERYAKGEINKGEFDEKRKDLE